MQIITVPDERLRYICRPDFIINRETIDEMFDIMNENNGVGLAANQVGINARMFIVAWGEVFINPVIKLRSEYEYVEEGCLSLPGRIYRCRRANRILMDNGAIYTGWKAVVIQHELNHLDGRLITDADLPVN